MKERMLKVLVPIKDSDAIEVNELPTIDSRNINVIYKLGNTYKRLRKNQSGNYEYVDVIDREFPYLGKPLEIFNFTYDAVRMGPAPTISAQGVMWFADKDRNNKDVTLEDLWSQDCHVCFNGENFYLKQIPTSQKNNEDARYKYDLDFVSERVVLENVYLYDVVQPFFTEKPVSESSKFSFFGDVSELAKRINVSLIRSNLSRFVLRDNQSETTHPRLLADNITHASDDQYFSYTDWLAINVGTYNGPLSTKDPYNHRNQYGDYDHYHENIFDHYGGDYNAYLRNEVYELDDDGNPVVVGYICKIGKDKFGDKTKSDEKLITFEDDTIYAALQQIKDTFDLQYYTVREKGSDGEFTGNTLIMVADCEHDFADLNQDGTDFVRNDDGIPMTAHPLDYGIDNALLSKEKTNTTDKIITRITGVGSSENIPWHYPNPTGDGWIKPVYKRDGVEQEVDIDYPISEGNDTPSYVRYEKYLKNRIGDVFQYGKKTLSMSEFSLNSDESTIDGTQCTLVYDFNINEQTKIKSNGFNCSFENTSVSYQLYKNEVDVTNVSNAFLVAGGTGDLQSGLYRLNVIITFNGVGPAPVSSVDYYYYPELSLNLNIADTFTWQWIVLFLIPIVGNLSAVGQLINNEHYTIPAFLSTNPNLRPNYSADGSKQGWYDGETRIGLSQMFFGQPNSSYYAFKGGNGQCTLGVDDVYKVEYGNDTQEHLYGELTTIDFNSMTDCQNFIVNCISGHTRDVSNKPYLVQKCSPDIDSFITQYIAFGFEGFLCDGWYKGQKKQDLSQYGIVLVDDNTPDISDTIEFRRVKYVTPQPNLMPEVYIKTDGERRFYTAKDYYPLQVGTADEALGEIQSGTRVINPLYKDNESDADNKHYRFENPYISNQPKEHIQSFEDIKPSITGQTNKIIVDNQEVTFRVDVVEEFAYDELDNNEIWESSDDGNISGEYKHPYIFAKLRPLGFNLFDMALQEDMVLSMTTGHCGACNFRIGVDENTKKNPVQIWEYDVYEGSDWNTKVLKYHAGELRRYVDESNLFYDTDGTQDGYRRIGYIFDRGFLVNDSSNLRASYDRTVYSTQLVLNGEVGSLKQDNRKHFDGDVKVNGRFIASQQDTSENYVWVALFKDTDTYGTVMPSAQPDYGDDNYSRYIEPKGAHYYDRKAKQWFNLSDDEADKFVLVNIRFPQIYLRRAEHRLSQELIKYMYEHNYQMFNFSIGFSRIFLADNDEIEHNINENSVLYVSFNNRTYRQYVKHYSYTMNKDAVLPEISVDMNEELSVSRTAKETAAKNYRDIVLGNRTEVDAAMKTVAVSLSKTMVGKNDDVVLRGNVVAATARASFSDINNSVGTISIDLSNNHFRKDDFRLANGTDLTIGDEIHLPTMYRDGRTLKRRVWNEALKEYSNDSTPIIPVEATGAPNAVNTIESSTAYNNIIHAFDQIDGALRCASVSVDGVSYSLQYNLPNVREDISMVRDVCSLDNSHLWFQTSTRE